MAPLADLLLPPLCFGCGNRLAESADLVCEDCQLQVILPPEDVCPVCGTQLEADGCGFCNDTVPVFDLARSAFLYTSPVKEIIHALKYNSYSSLSPWLVKCMLHSFHAEPRFEKCDLVTAVPLYRTRQRERGYNQSELLGKELARHLGLEFAMVAQRVHHTPSQTHLSKSQREHNLDSAFRLRRRANLEGRNILLIDDVFTTGTTVNKLSRVLKDHGAVTVAVLTAARAI